MKPIFLIMGTPACGKSSVSRALASRFDLEIHIPLDDVRRMVAGGLSEMDFESENSARATGLQIRLARESVSNMARIYNNAGFTVTIDDFWFNDVPGTFLNLGFQGVPETHYQLDKNLHKIVLLPSLDVTLERLFQRSSPDDGFTKFLEAIIREQHPVIQNPPKTGWHVVDSSALSVEQIVDLILEIINTKRSL
jgi:hypothetical protein